VLSGLRAAETATIGRCVLVTVEAAIGPEAEHLQALREAASAAASLRPGDTFRVACKRRGRHWFSSQDVQREVGLHLERTTPGVFRFEDPDYLIPVEIFQDLAYLGGGRRCRRPSPGCGSTPRAPVR
jgi:tRNA(Ser,Leu) C12 N-acetylase TAN1